MESLSDLVVAAQAGDVDAYGRLVQATQTMACAVAVGVLRTDLCAGRRQQATCRGSIVSATWRSRRRYRVGCGGSNHCRAQHTTGQTDDAAGWTMFDVPVLDNPRLDGPTCNGIAGVGATLTPEERQVCDRRYHGRGPSPASRATPVLDEAAMRENAFSASGTSCVRRLK
jgi:hypothetical protein